MWKKIILQFKKRQEEFVRAAQRLDKSKREASGVCGSWSPKQVVAHMSGWNKEVIRQFQLFQEGLQKAIEHDIDEFNKKSVHDREHLSWKETLDELRRIHIQFNRQAESISLDEVSRNEEYMNWMRVQIEHYEHHLNQLKKWVNT